MPELWFDSHATALFALDEGAGRPIILLHGGLATHQTCRRFAAPPSLDGSRFRVITPDLRASGRSIYRGELSWDLFADDVAALARHLGLDRVAVGGISFGTGVAIRAALRFPRLVDALVLLHPAYGGAEMGLLAAQQAAMAAMDAAGSRAIAEGVGVLYPLLDAVPADLRARARETFATYDPASVAASTRFMASGAQPFGRASELAAIDAPTLVVPGVDPYHPVEVAGVYERHVPHVRVIDTADFASAIAAFLE